VLSFFGISLPVVQVGGGLIVISTGWAMLSQKDTNDQGSASERSLARMPEPGVLPADASLDSRSRAPSRLRSLWARMRRSTWFQTCWLFSRRRSVPLSWPVTIYLCYAYADRLARQARSHGDNRNLKTHRVPADVHWSADLVERREQIAQLVAAVCRSCSASALKAKPAVGVDAEVDEKRGTVNSSIR